MERRTAGHRIVGADDTPRRAPDTGGSVRVAARADREWRACTGPERSSSRRASSRTRDPMLIKPSDRERRPRRSPAKAARGLSKTGGELASRGGLWAGRASFCSRRTRRLFFLGFRGRGWTSGDGGDTRSAAASATQWGPAS